MKAILDVLKLSSEYLEKQGVESPRKSAEETIADALGISRLDLYLEHDRPLTEPELQKVRAAILRRSKGEPEAYIRGKVEFYGCEISVTPAVLIPRQETEILADKIIKELKGVSLKGRRFLDLCTGSGCLGLAVKKACPELDVILSDISEEALNVAKNNACLNQLSVEFLLGDLLSPLKKERVDYVVCNPPYISQAEYDVLSREVRDFEPKTALLGGVDGLAFYRRLKEELPLHLVPGGKVWLEIGAAQGAAVLALFSAPIWKRVRLEKDWSSLDRFISLEME